MKAPKQSELSESKALFSKKLKKNGLKGIKKTTNQRKVKRKKKCLQTKRLLQNICKHTRAQSSILNTTVKISTVTFLAYRLVEHFSWAATITVIIRVVPHRHFRAFFATFRRIRAAVSATVNRVKTLRRVYTFPFAICLCVLVHQSTRIYCVCGLAAPKLSLGVQLNCKSNVLITCSLTFRAAFSADCGCACCTCRPCLSTAFLKSVYMCKCVHVLLLLPLLAIAIKLCPFFVLLP